MTEEDVLLPRNFAKETIINIFTHLAEWPIKSATAFRNAIIGESDSGLAINPLLNITQEYDVNLLKRMIQTTVQEGRMIDFGFLPNELIKDESARSREVFEAGELTHPYPDWLGVTSWEGGFNGYHISPHPNYPNLILVVELYGVHVPVDGIEVDGGRFGRIDFVLIYDIISIELTDKGTMVTPHYILNEGANYGREAVLRGANSLEPLITMLSILANASVSIIHNRAPMKLNLQRIKKGKPQLPSHTTVKTIDYVSSFKAAKSAARVDRGGHHASPIPHWRRSHTRTIASGRVVPVKSSKVNWRDREELHRMFYRIKKEGQ